jgi:bifunctional N-acetylglucosamine-1-phosphate-uridyltransferase/glucosamine-1-phosphate-acetyltransferase GlmU-like protein
MANPKLSVIPTREELGTASNALIALLKGKKKLPSEQQNRLLMLLGDEPDMHQKMMDDMRNYKMKIRK